MDAETESTVHVVCVPHPSQAHITLMLNLAEALNYKGFHITIVHLEYNYRRVLKSRGPKALDGTPTFRYEFIPDGLPEPDETDVNQTNMTMQLNKRVKIGMREPFIELIQKLNDPSSGRPPVTHIISDCVIPFAVEAAKELGNLPVIFLWIPGVCGYLGYSQYKTLQDKGIVPFKDSSYKTDGSLDMVVDWVPSMNGMKLKDLPSFRRITGNNFTGFDTVMAFTQRPIGYPIIINSFEALEYDGLKDMSHITTSPMYTIAPMHLLNHAIKQNIDVGSFRSNFWKEDSQCFEWLEKWEPQSVIYASFGSITTMKTEEIIEFAWGLANSNHPFLWVIRKDIIIGDSAILPSEFLDEVKDRSLIVSWCDQIKVLNHSSIGGFLTHCGWTSILESVTSGVPLICWPFFGEQQPNSWYCCNKWGIGVELNSDVHVDRQEVQKLIKEIIAEEKGREIRRNALEWKVLANEAMSSPNGSSYLNFERLVEQEFLTRNKKKNHVSTS